MQLLIFILVVFGLVEIIIKGKPTKPIRNLLSRCELGKDFIHCPLCIGFWAGIFCGVLIMPAYTNGLNVYLSTMLDFWFNGFIGAGTSYFLHTWITPPDLGFNGEENHDGDN